jgi:PAS domain S-box-containing protein
MSETNDERDLQDLRELAERRLEDGPHPAPLLPETPEALHHELSVHQIELTLQNEALQQTVLQLQQTQERYVRLYDFAPVGYLTLNRGGTIQEANMRAGQLLGVERSRLVGRRLAQFTAPESRSTLAALLPKLLSSTDGLVADLRLQRGDGRVFPIRLEGQADPLGGCLIAVMDVSIEKAAQEQLMQLNETLEGRVTERTTKIRELSEELQTVSLAVAEDLMAPLHRIAAVAHVLHPDRSSIPEASVGHVDALFHSVNRMEQLTQALLEYSRASSMRVRLVPLDLNRVFTDIEKELRPQMKGRAVQLTRGPLPTVLADIGTMQLVFLKVLDNALKFTTPRETARIHVSAEETESAFVLRFEDNGVGFNNRHRQQLFGVFKRLHLESAFPGTGIGLAIVRRSCTRFGGRVWAEGRIDEGATFFVSWPKQPTVLE